MAPSYGIIVLLAVAAFGGEVFFGFGLFFAPGWANGWPGGLTIHRVWSAFMTTYLFVLMMTVGIGAGGLIGLLLRLVLGNRRTTLVFYFWLLICSVFTVLTCINVYPEIYASTLEMWPNGYPTVPWEPNRRMDGHHSLPSRPWKRVL